jgi:hypothetical protein
VRVGRFPCGTSASIGRTPPVSLVYPSCIARLLLYYPPASPVPREPAGPGYCGQRKRLLQSLVWLNRWFLWNVLRKYSGQRQHPQPCQRQTGAVYKGGTPGAHRVYTSVSGMHPVCIRCTPGVHGPRYPGNSPERGHREQRFVRPVFPGRCSGLYYRPPFRWGRSGPLFHRKQQGTYPSAIRLRPPAGRGPSARDAAGGGTRTRHRGPGPCGPRSRKRGRRGQCAGGWPGRLRGRNRRPGPNRSC